MAHRWPHMAIATLALLHWSVILVHNAASLLASREQPTAWLEPVINWLPVATYALYSGTNTGYGFFAPAVGSNYGLHVSLYDEHGRLLYEGTDPGLRTLEGRLRYQAFLDVFRNLLPAGTAHPGQGTSLESRYARAVARSIAGRLALRYQAAGSRCQVLLYRELPRPPLILYEN